MKVVILMWWQQFYCLMMLYVENLMKLMPWVMASWYLLLLKIKNVYLQSICFVFWVFLRIVNCDENFMVVSQKLLLVIMKFNCVYFFFVYWLIMLIKVIVCLIVLVIRVVNFFVVIWQGISLWNILVRCCFVLICVMLMQ